MCAGAHGRPPNTGRTLCVQKGITLSPREGLRDEAVRTAIYIEGGVIQLVLTPDNEWEKRALNSFAEKPVEAQIFDGAFYDCRGGWTRQTRHYESLGGYSRNEDRSLILRIAQPQLTELPKD